MSFSFIELVTKEKKDLWQQDERYRIIGHIRCRPKNLAIHLNGNTESFVENCSMSSCCQIKWKFYSRKPVAKYQLNKRKYFRFCINYHLQFRNRTCIFLYAGIQSDYQYKPIFLIITNEILYTYNGNDKVYIISPTAVLYPGRKSW